MMNNMINGNITSIEQMTDYIGKDNSKNNVSKTYDGKHLLIYIIRNVQLKRLFLIVILMHQRN